jgi:CHAT domain-containing protein
VVSSYTPTLTALLQARQDVQVRAPSATQVLMITAQYPKDTSLPRLPGVAQESRVVCEAATAAGASFHETERGTAHSDVILALKSAHIVHLACHGVQHASEPHKSRFCLSSGDLTIEELMQVDLKDAFCAFLSACETAKGDRQYADEVVHLAASMLFAGFKSVVATLW